MVDYKVLFGLCLGLLGVVFGVAAYLISRELNKKDAEIAKLHGRCDALSHDIGEVRDRHNETLQNLPMIYARRDDMKEFAARIEATVKTMGEKISASMERIYDKLDTKADKE